MFHGRTWKRAAEVSLGLLLSAAAGLPVGYGGEPVSKRAYSKPRAAAKAQPVLKRGSSETIIEPEVPIQIIESERAPVRKGIFQSLFAAPESSTRTQLPVGSVLSQSVVDTSGGRDWRPMDSPARTPSERRFGFQLTAAQPQTGEAPPSEETLPQTPDTETPLAPETPEMPLAPETAESPFGPMPPAESAETFGPALTQAGGQSSTINTEGINSPPQTTGDLLENAPEVSTRRTSALNQDARIRAYHSGQIGATANGINQYKTRIDIDSLFSAIDPGLIQSIDVINGPYTPLYGPAFGFLAARLFESPRSDGGLTGGGNVLYDQATNGGGIYTRETAWGAGEYWGAYFSYGLRAASDYSPGGNSLDFRVPASYQTWNAYLAAGVDLTSRSRLEFNYLRNEVNGLELPGVIYDINNAHTDQINARYIVQEDREGPENFVVQYWYTRDEYYGDSQRFSKHLTFYDRYITANFSGFGPPPPNPGPDYNQNLANTFSRGDQMSHGFRTYGTIGEVDSVQLTVGADWRRYDKFYLEQHLDFSGVPGNVPFGLEPFGIPSSSMEDYGFFANVSIPIGEDIQTNIGGRIDKARSFVGFDEINLNPDNTNSDDPLANQAFAGYDHADDVLGMAYIRSQFRLTETLYLEPGFGFGTRMPTLDELYSDAVFVPLIRGGNSIIVGESGLEPEKGIQFDLGLRHDGPNFYGSMRGFYSEVYDYILYNFLGTAGANTDPSDPFASKVYQYTNLDQATLYGCDVFGEWRPRDSWFSVFGSLAYLRGINHDAKYLNNAQSGLVDAGADALPGIYPLNSILGVRFFDPDTQWWSVTFQTRMVKGQDIVSATLFELPTPGFTTLDIIGSVQATKNMRVFSSLENVFDRTYTEHGSLLLVNQAGGPSFVKEPGINFRVGVELTY